MMTAIYCRIKRYIWHCNNKSEWLLFSATSAIVRQYHSENKLIFNEMVLRSAFYLVNLLSWILIALVNWHNNPRIDMSPNFDTLSWFRANQPLPLLINSSCIVEKQQIPFV
jgi:hypothetical protein